MGDRRYPWYTGLFYSAAGHSGHHGGSAASLGIWKISLCGGAKRGGGALFWDQYAPHYRQRLCGRRHPDGGFGDLVCVLHELDFAVFAWQLLRAVRDRSGGAWRLQPAGWRRLDLWDYYRGGIASGPAEPGEPAQHPDIAELRRDGCGDLNRSDCRPVAAAQAPARIGSSSFVAVTRGLLGGLPILGERSLLRPPFFLPGRSPQWIIIGDLRFFVFPQMADSTRASFN